MTDDRTPLSDEDLSAIIDGEADDHVIDQFQQDPDARERVRELQRASDLVRSSTITPLSASAVDDLIANAFAALGDEKSDGEDSERDAEVVEFAAPPRRSRSGPPVWLVAAAVALFAAVGIGLVWSGTRDGGNGQEQAAAPTTPEDAKASEEGKAHVQTPSEAQPFPFTIVDLGSFDTKADLRAALKTSFPSRSVTDSSTAAPPTAAVQRCASQMYEVLRGQKIEQTPTHIGYASLAGETVLVYDFATTEGPYSSIVTAVSPDACDVRLDPFVRI